MPRVVGMSSTADSVTDVVRPGSAALMRVSSCAQSTIATHLLAAIVWGDAATGIVVPSRVQLLATAEVSRRNKLCGTTGRQMFIN